MAGYNDPQMQSVLDHIRRYSHSSNNGDPISGKPFFILFFIFFKMIFVDFFWEVAD